MVVGMGKLAGRRLSDNLHKALLSLTTSVPHLATFNPTISPPHTFSNDNSLLNSRMQYILFYSGNMLQVCLSHLIPCHLTFPALPNLPWARRLPQGLRKSSKRRDRDCRLGRGPSGLSRKCSCYGKFQPAS